MIEGPIFVVRKQGRAEWLADLCCPNCGEESRFRLRSDRVAEDLCEVFAVCATCGQVPPSTYCMESVMGDVGNENIMTCLASWIDWLKDLKESHRNSEED
jgi:hypothetical protein